MRFNVWLEQNLEAMNAHIQNLIARNQEHVIQDISVNGFSYYDADNAVAHIHKRISSAMQYWHALHELGHVELGHRVPSNWDEEARMEINAWDYVKKNSIVSIPALIMQQWESERIKGSWEKKH